MHTAPPPDPKRRRRWYNPISILRSIYLRPRVYLGAAVGIALLWFMPGLISAPVRETTAWCLGAAVYLVLAFRLMRSCHCSSRLLGFLLLLDLDRGRLARCQHQLEGVAAPRNVACDRRVLLQCYCCGADDQPGRELGLTPQKEAFTSTANLKMIASSCPSSAAISLEPSVARISAEPFGF